MIPIFFDYIEGQAEQFLDHIRTMPDIAIIETHRQSICDPWGDFHRHYRTCIVIADTATFSCANSRKIIWVIAYKKGTNFNIVPPTLEPFRKSVFDAIGHIPDITEYPEI